MHWTVADRAPTLDWTLCRGNGCAGPASLVMEGIAALEWNADRFAIVPRLAKSWQFLSENQIVFKLDRDVKWSDGTPLSSEHFVHAWKRLLQSHPKNPNASLLFPIAGAQEFALGRAPFSRVAIRTPDPRTLLVRLSAPCPGFVARLAHHATFPNRHAVRANEAFPIVLGPYVPEEAAPAEVNHFSANPDYHGRQPVIRRVTIRHVDDVHDRIAMFLGGETDLIDTIGVETSALLSKHSNLHAYWLPEIIALERGDGSRGVKSRRTREALFAGVDRQAISRVLRWPHAPAEGLQIFSALSAGGGWTLSLKRATKRRTISGPVSLSLAADGSPELREIAREIRAQWQRALGIPVETAPASGPATLRLVRIPLDPYRLDQGLAEAAARHLAPPLRSPRETADAGHDAQAFLSRVEDILRRDAAVYPLLLRAEYAMISPRVSGLTRAIDGSWRFERAALAQ